MPLILRTSVVCRSTRPMNPMEIGVPLMGMLAYGEKQFSSVGEGLTLVTTNLVPGIPLMWSRRASCP